MLLIVLLQASTDVSGLISLYREVGVQCWLVLALFVQDYLYLKS